MLVSILAATSMKWIEAKMAELGVLKNPSFKIAMFVDDGAMITVQDEEGHVVRFISLFCFNRVQFFGEEPYISTNEY